MSPPRSRAVPGVRQAAAASAVARVMVDVPLPHLDRPFDYLVSAELDASVHPGSRVRVRFAGRLVDGYVLERVERSEHPTRLAFLERAVGDEPVLTDETAALFRAVADRYGGSFVDVARLGVPPRHARAQSGAGPRESLDQLDQLDQPDQAGWARYRTGPSYLSALRSGRAARAVWSALPGEQWPERMAEAVQTVASGGRGAIVVVPDARDLTRLDAQLTRLLGTGRHVALSADLGPAERYRRWLAARRGQVQIVIGTRSAAYAPVAGLALLAIWDDGDDLHRDLRAPYPDARDVLSLRSSATGAALLIGGFARTAEAQQLVESGWAHEIVADRAVLRAASATVTTTGDDYEQLRDPAALAARLPSLAWRTARQALESALPVLVQVPRRGYVPALACARDRSPARCASCSGPLAATSGDAIATCRWCGSPAGDWTCPSCGGRRMRAVTVGSARTAEELGRAFPGVVVRVSGGEHVLGSVDPGPGLVVATPGAEPVVTGGYGAALLLDGWSLLARPDLRAGEEALRRWMNAAALVRPGGRVVLAADPAIAVVQALIRWDPAGSAARELAERAELRFPPAVRMASLTGSPAAVEELLAAAELPEPHEVIGPVPAGAEQIRTLIRVPRQQGGALAEAIHRAASARSARKASEPVKTMLDPRELF